MSGRVGVSVDASQRAASVLRTETRAWDSAGLTPVNATVCDTVVDVASRRMLAVALGPPDMPTALRELTRVRAEADCVELRLDLIGAGFDLPVLLRERG